MRGEVLNIPELSGATAVEPADEKETAAVLRNANETGQAVIPTGGGTKLDWGNPPRKADILLSMRRQNRVIEHAWADLTVTVEAGCTIAELQRTLAQHGQRLAIDPLWPERATIGGVLSTNDSGALRLGYGSPARPDHRHHAGAGGRNHREERREGGEERRGIRSSQAGDRGRWGRWE